MFNLGFAKAMRQYSSDSRLRTFVHRVQVSYGCCGLRDHGDWLGNASWAMHSQLTDAVPYSCCRPTLLYPCRNSHLALQL